ncbi:MAG: hypothetical protein ACO35Q_06890, partial [Prochlorothrix sp.]
LSCSADGQIVMAGDVLGNLLLWHAETQRQIACFRSHERGSVRLVRSGLAGRLVLEVGQNPCIQAWYCPRSTP